MAQLFAVLDRNPDGSQCVPPRGIPLLHEQQRGDAPSNIKGQLFKDGRGFLVEKIDRRAPDGVGFDAQRKGSIVLCNDVYKKPDGNLFPFPVTPGVSRIVEDLEASEGGEYVPNGGIPRDLYLEGDKGFTRATEEDYFALRAKRVKFQAEAAAQKDARDPVKTQDAQGQRLVAGVMAAVSALKEPAKPEGKKGGTNG